MPCRMACGPRIAQRSPDGRPRMPSIWTPQLRYNFAMGRRGRAVEGTSLENWQRGNPFVSSNLTASEFPWRGSKALRGSKSHAFQIETIDLDPRAAGYD
jgi:hypothetical protein